MSTQITKSPAQIGSTVVRFPDQSFGRLFIRLESGGTFKTHIKFGQTDASATNSDMFLDSGEAITIRGNDVPGSRGSNISIFNETGDPKIFWYFE